MPQVSTFALSVFLMLIVIIAWAWLSAMRHAAPRGEAPTLTKRWSALAVFILVLWLLIPAALAETGWLRRFAAMPPPFAVMMIVLALTTTWLAFSAIGTRLVTGLNIGALIGFQMFRVPLEWWLHRVYQEGVIPVQMTYSGRNFDIITGLLAIALLFWARVGRLPRWAIWGFNLLGLALLINIVTIALLSAPLPFRKFMNEPANTFIAYWPYVWLPTFLVQAALFGHLLVFRWLRRN